MLFGAKHPAEPTQFFVPSHYISTLFFEMARPHFQKKWLRENFQAEINKKTKAFSDKVWILL